MTENLHFKPGVIFTQGVTSALYFRYDHNVTGTVDFNQFKKFISALDPNDNVEFSADENRLLLSVNGKQEMSLDKGGMDDQGEINELPIIPKPDAAKGFFRIGELNLRDIGRLSESIDFVGSDELRPAMCHISLGKNIYSTDGHTLYFNTTSDKFMTETVEPSASAELNKEKIEKDGVDFRQLPESDRLAYMMLKETPREQFLISSKLAKMIVKTKSEARMTIFFENDKSVCQFDSTKMRVSGTEWIQVNSGNYIMIERCCDERYPDVKNVIPDYNSRNHFATMVDTQVLLKAVKAATAVANSTTHQVALRFDAISEDQESLKVESNDLDFGSKFSRVIPANTRVMNLERKMVKVVMENGEETEEPAPTPKMFEAIGFNGKLFMKALTKVTNERILLRYESPNRALVLENRFLIMPVMLNNNV